MLVDEQEKKNYVSEGIKGFHYIKGQVLGMSLISIRRAIREDAEAIIKAHYDAVHCTAAKDYDTAILDQWSAAVTKERVESYKANFDPNKESTVVAEINGKVVAFGSIKPATAELNAVYVSPEAARQGAGSALVKELEKTARSMGINKLWLDSSLTAEKFYASHGFISEGKAEHVLKSGLKMACVKMHKCLEDKEV